MGLKWEINSFYRVGVCAALLELYSTKSELIWVWKL